MIIPDKDSKGNVVHKNEAFASKDNLHFRGKGLKQSIAANGGTYIFDHTVTFECKFNGLELLYALGDDTAELKILDDSNGTYSTVPNYTLDQFGYTWNVGKEYYKKELEYEAHLYPGMRIVVEYTNNYTSAVNIAVNFNIHKVV